MMSGAKAPLGVWGAGLRWRPLAKREALTEPAGETAPTSGKIYIFPLLATTVLERKMRYKMKGAAATVGPDSSNKTTNDTINDTIKLTQTEELVLAEIQKNPHITRDAISKILGIGQSTVYRTIKRPREYGLLERVGSNKTGYWKVKNI